MATKKFPSELALRGTVLVTDKLLIHNITTGATSYCTVANLFASPVFTGNVGIGTTAPNELLEVAGTNKRVIFSDGGGASRKVLIMEPLGYASHTYSRIESYDYGAASGANLVLNALGGSVGIGTAAPTSKLQVVGLPVYNDNANAAASGLTSGAFYRTGETLKVVY